MRSKTLLISNILATVYSGYMLWWFGTAINEAGGLEYVSAVGDAFKILESFSIDAGIIKVILILLCVHIIAVVLGCIIGWIAYLARKSGGAKFSATLYLISTICFPFYLYFTLLYQ